MEAIKTFYVSCQCGLHRCIPIPLTRTDDEILAALPHACVISEAFLIVDDSVLPSYRIGSCDTCGDGWATLWLGHVMTDDGVRTVRQLHPTGRWHGYIPPEPATAGGVTLLATIATSYGESTFSWSMLAGDDGWQIPVADPSDEQHAALLRILAEHGPAAAALVEHIYSGDVEAAVGTAQLALTSNH